MTRHRLRPDTIRFAIITVPAIISMSLLVGCDHAEPETAAATMTTAVVGAALVAVPCGTCALDGRVAPPC